MLKIIYEAGCKIFRKSDQIVLAICISLACGIFFIDSLIPLGVAGGVPYILIVLVSLWSKNTKLPFYMAVTGSILTIMGFYSSPSGGDLWKVITNRSLALFAIWAVAVLCVQRVKIHEQKEKALSELKILHGLLPICAGCKKIRNDKGCWDGIESYITEHSEAKFTHGICPDCHEELYGDILFKNIAEG